MKKIMMSVLVASSLAMAGGDIAPVEPVVETPVVEDTNAWQQELTIYGWLAGIDGNLKIPVETGTPISVDTSDIIDNLKMVLMGTYGVRYDKWSFYGDVVYMDVGNDKTVYDGTYGDMNVDVDIKTLLVNAGVGYNIVNSDKNMLDIAAGVRYMDLEVNVETNLPRRSGGTESKDLTDFVVGIRGHYNINENWYIPYAADIGTGDSELTWQAFAGVGYRYDWGDVKLGYRHIDYDFEDDMFMEDLAISGAILGVSVKF